jgi:aspartate/methionine/tyrosine aminotransferase
MTEVLKEMSGAPTKKTIIQRHATNELLQAPTLPPMQRAQGRDLSVEQPTMYPDPAIVESAAAATEQRQTHYVDVPGIAPLREMLAETLKDVGLVGYEQANVLVTAGIQECRFLSIQMIGESFGCIALPDVVHPGARKAAGVRKISIRSLPVDVENGMLPTLQGMRETLESGCKLLYLESPVRLTGAVFDAATVSEIAAMIHEFDAAVIWDQGTAPWIQNARYVSLGGQPGVAERVAVFGEAWPGVGLESWFIGYVAANEDWFESMRSQKQMMSICTSTPSQFGAIKAAEVYANRHAAQVEELAQCRREALEVARKLDARPLTGAAVNLIAVRLSDPGQVSTALRDGGFWFADGADFGAQGVLRLSVTTDKAVVEALSSCLVEDG